MYFVYSEYSTASSYDILPRKTLYHILTGTVDIPISLSDYICVIIGLTFRKFTHKCCGMSHLLKEGNKVTTADSNI